MFHRHRLIDLLFSVVFVFTVASCDLGAGCGCNVQPLPEGGLPADQTLEGGAQVRITQSGFSKITSLIPDIINDALGSGFCIPESEVFDVIGTSATVCGANEGGCSPGCPVSLAVDYVNVSAADQNINVQVQFDVHADVHIDYSIIFIPGSCNADFDLSNGFVDIDVALGIDPVTGELVIHPAEINTLDITGINVSGCGLIGAIVDAALDLFANLLNSFLGDIFFDIIRPMLDDLLQGLLPDPLGIEGMVDVGSLIGAVSPGTNATLEMRAVPGGFVNIVQNGLTLGVIMGANADQDLVTRTPDLDNETAYCVPPVAAPDFAAEPAPLPTSPRGTFILSAADEFVGNPEPDADVAVGVSETTLDLLGHHAFTSGALCLGIGPDMLPQLNLGLIGILVPSFAELGSDEGSDPLLLVTRPVQTIDFTIGEGTEASPSLTIHLREFEIDFYAFIFERYVRGFTVRLGMNVGINLEFSTLPTGEAAIMPVLTGLSTEDIQVTALNTEFLRETEEDLASTLPSILELALPLITDALQPIALPELGGFSLGNLGMSRVVTSEDEFLAITATMASAAPLMKKLGEKYPALARRAEAELAALPERADTRASLRSVTTPAPEAIRAGLAGRTDGAVPSVVIDVEPYDHLGRRLEWTWNIGGGIWRPFTQETPLVIDAPVFAWQGPYEIQVAARVAGDYRTLDLEPVRIPVTIDSVGPRIHVQSARLRDGGIQIPANDLVDDLSDPDRAIELAFGHPADGAPATEWRAGPLSIDDARALAQDQMVAVYARDKSGNISKALLDVGRWLPSFHGHGEAGCGCAAGTDERGLGGLGALFVLTLALLAARGRRRSLRRASVMAMRSLGRRVGAGARALPLSLILYVGVGVAAATLPACDCGGAQTLTCEQATCAMDEECDFCCGQDQLGVCLSSQCLCTDDLAWGRFGQYSEMALGPTGAAWVSAYNSTYGDLTVARAEAAGPIAQETWQFVDGVPEGPVVLARSERRGGIEAPGEDVGRYTSIAVNRDDQAMVSYFDVDNGSLKLASNASGEWQTHVVAAGNVPTDPELGYEIVGQYSSITLEPSSQRPGIAYFVQKYEAGELRTEVRFSSSQSPTPTGPSDWITYVVESAVVPDPTAPDPLSIPQGVGLFIDSARQTDGTPVVVYYDRMNGDLKLARFNLMDGVFNAPEVLDGSGIDVGWYPSLAVDQNNDVHVSYVDATNDDLMYINTIDRTPELVDDGYRLVGTTEDGLPKPEFHLVGDDSNIVLTSLGPAIVYQDATTHELLRSRKNGSGLWEFKSLAGNEIPFVGGYGFYASATYDGQDLVISSWVVHQPANRVWVEIFRDVVVIE